MGKFVCLIVVLSCYSSATFAQLKPDTPREAGEHLLEVNKEWEGRVHSSYSYETRFASDNERIAFHLQQVIKVLELSTKYCPKSPALANRQWLLDSLASYAKNKAFPVNTHYAIRTPYFIDDFNNYCAVGYLMKASGHNDLALRIQEAHNYDYIRDIETEGVIQWAAEHGFTVNELALIQPSYGPSAYTFGLGKSIDGPVTSMWNHKDSLLYIAGTFKTLGEVPCGGLMTYDGNELKCLDIGLKGVIKDLVMGKQGLYLIGDLEYDNQKAHIARFDGENVFLFPELMPPYNRPVDMVIVQRNGKDSHLRLAIKNSTDPEKVKIIRVDEQSFQTELFLEGDFNGMNQSVIAGFYSKVTIYDDIIYRMENGPINMLLNKGEKWYPLNIKTREETFPVLEIEEKDGWTYALLEGNESLFRVDENGRVDTLYSDIHVSGEVFDMEFTDRGTIVACGPASFGPSMETSRNLGVFYPMEAWGISTPYAFDGILKVVKHFKSKTIVGGDFHMDEYFAGDMASVNSEYEQPKIGYLVWLGGPMSLEMLQSSRASVYPNPAKNQITITLETKEEPGNLNIYTLQGQKLSVPTVVADQGWTIDVSSLPNGQYWARITEDGVAQLSTTFSVVR